MAKMITKESMMELFDKLYMKMSVSKNIDDMRLFGRVMREAMEELAVSRPERAEELLDELCAVNWKNYLTRKEADAIIAHMDPQPKWNREQLIRLLNDKGLPLEEEPFYNEQALYVEVSKVCSDSGVTLAELLYSGDEPVESELLAIACYKLALDHLKDKDGVYNIRKYFGL